MQKPPDSLHEDACPGEKSWALLMGTFAVLKIVQQALLDPGSCWVLSGRLSVALQIPLVHCTDLGSWMCLMPLRWRIHL